MIKRILTLRNAPKGLSSEFHPIRSHTGTTSYLKTANGTDPLVKRTGPVNRGSFWPQEGQLR